MFLATNRCSFVGAYFVDFILQEEKREAQQFDTALKLAAVGRLILSSRERTCSTFYLPGEPKELHSSCSINFRKPSFPFGWREMLIYRQLDNCSPNIEPSALASISYSVTAI
jgi:hypothetical protein